MERYYIFFRCWEHFSPDFQVEKFNDLRDEEINGAVEKDAVDWRRDHTVEFDRRVRDRNKELIAKLKARAKQGTHRPGAPEEFGYSSPNSVSSISRQMRKQRRKSSPFEPGPECSPGSRIAYFMGWISAADLHQFGGYSPSRRLFIMPVMGTEPAATEVVRTLTKWWPTSKSAMDYGHFGLRFGYVPASQFPAAEQAIIEADMKNLTARTPRDLGEEIQQSVVTEAASVMRQLEEILNRKEDQQNSKGSAGENASTMTERTTKEAEVDGAVANSPKKDGNGERSAVDLDSMACAYLVSHPEWTMTVLAEKLKCSRQHLYTLPKLRKLRELLKSGKFNLSAGTKSSDGSVEAWKRNPETRTCPVCRDEHKFACPVCDEDDLHCAECHIPLQHSD